MQYIYQNISELADSNLVEIYNEWSPTTTYSFESGTPTNASVVRYGAYYYRSVVSGNLNNNPEEYENIKWTKYGVSNKFALLDLSSNSSSIALDSNLMVKFRQSNIGTIGFGNFDARKVVVQLLNSSNVVSWEYDTGYFLNEGVTDYYSYIYETYDYKIYRAMIVNLPFIDYYVKITFYAQGELTTTSCGFLVGGNPESMGKTLTPINFKFNSFALKEVDDFGKLTITKRAVQDLVDFETVIDTATLPTFKRKLRDIYNDIILFVLDENEDTEYENLLTLGVIQDASIILNDTDKTIISYSVMESV